MDFAFQWTGGSRHRQRSAALRAGNYETYTDLILNNPKWPQPQTISGPALDAGFRSGFTVKVIPAASAVDSLFEGSDSQILVNPCLQMTIPKGRPMPDRPCILRRPRYHCVVIGLMTVMFHTAFSLADEKSERTATAIETPTSVEIQQTISDLGHPSFAIRAEASARLRAFGRAAADVIAEAAKNHPDLEVRDRASQIDRDFKLGLYPGVSAEVISAVRRLQSADPQEQRAAIISLAELGDFDRVLAAVSLPQDVGQRCRLASWMLHSERARSRFINVDGFGDLVGVIQRPGPNAQPALVRDDAAVEKSLGPNEWNMLFDSVVVTVIANSSQSESWFRLVETMPPNTRSMAWQRLAGLPSAVKGLLKSGGMIALTQLIERGENEKERRSLVAILLNNSTTVAAIIDEGGLEKALELSANPDSLITKVFSSSECAAAYVRQHSAKEFFALLGRLHNPNLRTSAINQFAEMFRLVHPDAINELAQLKAEWLETAEPDIRKVLLLAELTKMRWAANDSDEIEKLLRQLMKIESDLTASDWKSLVGMQSVAKRLLQPDHAKSLDKFLTTASPADSLEVLEAIAQSHAMMGDITTDAGKSFLRWIELTLIGSASKSKQEVDGEQLNEVTRPTIVAKLIGHLSYQSMGKIPDSFREDLLRLIGRSEDSAIRRDALSAFTGPPSLWYSLRQHFQNLARSSTSADQGSDKPEMTPEWFKLFVKQVTELPTENDRFEVWSRTLRHAHVLDALTSEGQQSILIGYRNPLLAKELRARMTIAILQNDACSAHLIASGETEQLVAAIDSLDDSDQSNYLLFRLHSLPAVSSQLGDEKKLNDVVRLFHELVPMYLTPAIESAAKISIDPKISKPLGDAFDRLIWTRISEIPEPQKHATSAILSNLVHSETWIGRLIADGRGDTLLPWLAAALPPDKFASLVSQFFQTKSSTVWIASVGPEAILRDVESALDGESRGLRLRVLDTAELVAHFETAGSLDLLWQRLRQSILDRRAGGNGNDRAPAFISLGGPIGRALLKAGYQPQLLEIISDPAGSIDREAWSSLIRGREFATSYLETHRASELVEMAIGRVDPDDVAGMLPAIFSNDALVRSLTASDQWDSLLEKLLSPPLAIPNALNMAVAMSSPSANPSISDHVFLDAFAIIKQSDSQQALSAQAQLLRSDVAVERLMRLGCEASLEKWATDTATDEYWQHPMVFRRMPLERQNDVLDRWLANATSNRIHSIASDAIFPEFVKARGLEPLLETPQARQSLLEHQRIWYQPDVVAALLTRGSADRNALSLIFDQVPKSSQRGALIPLAQSLSHPVVIDLLGSKDVVLQLLEFAERADVAGSATFNAMNHASIARASWDAGCFDRYLKLMAAQGVSPHSVRPGIGSAGPKFSYTDPIASEIFRGRYQDAADRLRNAADADASPELTLQLIRFLVQSELAESEIEKLAEIPIDALTPDLSFRRIMLLRAMGRLSEAIEVARQTKRNDLLTPLLVEAHQWTDARDAHRTNEILSKSEVEATASADTKSDVEKGLTSNPLRLIEDVASDGLLSMFAGDGESWLTAEKKLQSIADANDSLVAIEQAVSDNLILLQRVPEAIARLKHSPWRAYHLQTRVGFYDPALSRIGWGRKSPKDYFDGASQGQPITSPQRTRAVEFHIEVAQNLDRLGRHKQAREMIDAIADYADRQSDQLENEAKENASSPGDPFASRPERLVDSFRQSFVYQLLKRDRGDWIDALSERVRWKKNVSDARAGFTRFYSARSAATAPREILTDTRLLQNSGRNWSPSQRYLLVSQLTNSSPPTMWVRQWVDAANREFVEASRRKVSIGASLSMIEAIFAADAISHSTADLVDDQFGDRLASNSHQVDTLLVLGTASLRRKFNDVAVARLEHAFRYFPDRLDVRTLLDLAKTSKIGRDTAALSNDPESIALLAQSLADAGFGDLARSHWRLIRDTTLPRSRPNIAATQRLAELETDPAEQMQLRRELVWKSSAIAGDFNRRTEFLDQVESLRRSAMLAAIDQQDFDLLIEHWTGSRRINANDADRMPAIIRRVDEVGQTKIADEMFALTRKFLDSRVNKFNQSVEFRLSRAALCLDCGRDLEIAKTDLAEAALRIEEHPEDVASVVRHQVLSDRLEQDSTDRNQDDR